MEQQPESPGLQALRRVKKGLEGLGEAHSESTPVIKELLAEIEMAERELRRFQRPIRTRTGSDVRYLVQRKGPDEVLVEQRAEGTSPPFRTPKTTFDALVNVLGSAEHPVKYNEIREKAEEQLDFPPGEFQIRMVLRFLQRANPPVIRRQRGRYGPIATTKFQFRRLADAAWRASRE